MSNLLNAADVQRLANLYGLSIAELCRRSAIHPSLFYRWRDDGGDITLDSYSRLTAALTAAQREHQEQLNG